MASSTPTTRTPLTHRMDHNQPQQQPHRNPSPRSKTENSHAQAARPRTAGTSYQASRRPHPSSKPKGTQARQRDEGQQDSISSQQAAAPPHHRGQPRPRTTEASHTPAVSPRPAAPGCRYYSSSEMYPLATRRAYSLSINISSGDLMLHSTKERHPPGLIPTPCGETYRAS